MSGAAKALTGKGAAATRHAGGKYFWRGTPWGPAGWYSTFVRLGCQRARFGGGVGISGGRGTIMRPSSSHFNGGPMKSF